ncbi:MAG: aminoglycoside phosphotransferase family protein [Angelakisella sp.]
MNDITSATLQEIVTKFDFPASVTRVERFGNGHINDTFAVYLQEQAGAPKRFILQRINSIVFKKPREVLENIRNVTQYLRSRIAEAGGDPMRETLNMLSAKDGSCYAMDDDGEYWRVFYFIEDTITRQMVENKDDFYQSARAFGQFQKLLADYPAHTLHETIPNFHNTVERMNQLRDAIERDVCGRAKDVQAEIDFVLTRAQEASYLLDLQQAGKLPLRVTHNDTKLNNLLLDSQTGAGICVIDLDTVMPGLSAYDFGDAIRFGASSAAEDEPDLTKVEFVPALFDIYTKGYLEVTGDTLTHCEIDCLPMGAKLMTLECGSRFLADHLNGDVYYKIHREGHNLDRARTQFKLIEGMEAQWDAMKEIVNKYR